LQSELALLRLTEDAERVPRVSQIMKQPGIPVLFEKDVRNISATEVTERDQTARADN
jgi:hypothetical protein